MKASLWVLAAAIVFHALAARMRNAGLYGSFLLAAMVMLTFPASPAEGEFGRYSCRVEEVYGEDEIGQAWKHGTLLYDADAGTLEGAADPGGALQKQGLQRPLSRLFSRLKIETIPTKVSNLHAVQYDPAQPSITNPIMAWIMIETTENAVTPPFQFFSTTVRAILTGRCVKDSNTVK